MVVALGEAFANPERDHLLASIAGKIVVDFGNQVAVEMGGTGPAVHSPTLPNPMPPASRKPKAPRPEKTKRRPK